MRQATQQIDQSAAVYGDLLTIKRKRRLTGQFAAWLAAFTYRRRPHGIKQMYVAAVKFYFAVLTKCVMPDNPIAKQQLPFVLQFLKMHPRLGRILITDQDIQASAGFKQPDAVVNPLHSP